MKEFTRHLVRREETKNGEIAVLEVGQVLRGRQEGFLTQERSENTGEKIGSHGISRKEKKRREELGRGEGRIWGRGRYSRNERREGGKAGRGRKERKNAPAKKESSYTWRRGEKKRPRRRGWKIRKSPNVERSSRKHRKERRVCFANGNLNLKER